MSKAIILTGGICAVFILVGASITAVASDDDPPSELYVRTVPSGAKVLVDGKQVGKSDNLFKVEPGARKIEVELEGFEPIRKEVNVAAARIKRVVFELEKSPSESQPQENLLTNPGAEEGDKKPKAWQQGAAIPEVTYSWDKNNACEGKASLCIEKKANRYFPIASWTQVVERKGDAPTLELSAHVKAQKMTKAILDVLFLDKNDKWISHKWVAYIGSKQQGEPPADHDWKQYSGKVDVPSETAKIVVGLQVYGPGKVWFDDVRVREIGGKQEKSESKEKSNAAEKTPNEETNRMIELVEDFFDHNFRDVTARKTLEWGDVQNHPNGNKSISYKYLASIRGEESVVMNQTFTFDTGGKFVKWENVKGFPQKAGDASNLPATADEDVQRRDVGKKVADFPESVDLSTPESAWAAYHRASAREDAKAVVELSWVKIDPAEMERFWKNAEPADIAIYNKALLDAECVEVLVYRGELAAVISRLEFPPGKGRCPFSLRSFGLIDGKWKNLGEDRLPTLEAALAGFQQKKNAIWLRLSTTKDRIKSQSGDAPRPIKTSPEIGATDVDQELQEISVTFDRDMQVGNHSWCGSGPHFPKITGEPKWIDCRTCVLPVSLKKARAYRLAINWDKFNDFRSAEGVPAVPTPVYFCTRGASPKLIAQMTPPKIVALSIEDGAKDVPPGKTKLSVTFDQAMGEGMSWCNGSNTPKMEAVEGSSWSADKKTCSIYALLEPDKNYTIYLNSEHFKNFMNVVGVPINPTPWTFTTGATQ